MIPFTKMMVRQRIRTNYCLKDLLTVWMTKAQKIWIRCLKQLGRILLNKKKVWSINGPLFLTVKLSGKKQSNETRLFYKNTYGRRMWFKCTISMYYFKRIGILSKNALFTPIFWILWTVLKIISNHYFPARTHLFEKLATFSWMTKPQKRRTDLFQYLHSILQNDKDTKKKNFWLKKLVPLY